MEAVAAAAANSLQSCPTLCDPIDGSLSGSAVPGILQARTLEWGAIAFRKVLMSSLQIVYTASLQRTDLFRPGVYSHPSTDQAYEAGADTVEQGKQLQDKELVVGPQVSV